MLQTALFTFKISRRGHYYGRFTTAVIAIDKPIPNE